MKRAITNIIQPPRKPRFWEIVVWKAPAIKRSIAWKLMAHRILRDSRATSVPEPPASNYPTLHKEGEPTPMDEVNRQSAS